MQWTVFLLLSLTCCSFATATKKTTTDDEEVHGPSADNIRINDDAPTTTIKEAGEQSKDQPVLVISNKNTITNKNKKKKKRQTKAALKMTPMPAIIEEYEEVFLTPITATNKEKTQTQQE